MRGAAVVSNADLLTEAIDTAVRLFYAGAAWFALMAVVVGIVVAAVVVIVSAIGRWAWKTARRALRAPLADERAPQPPESTPSSQRRSRPSWAHEQPTTYEEAA